jgi:hypothetical protein
LDNTTLPSTNGHLNTEQEISTEIVLDHSSLSQEKDQILMPQKSESHPDNNIQDEEKLTSTTLPLQVENESTTANDKDIILNTIHKLIKDITQSVLSQLQQNSIKANQEVPSSDSDLAKPITPPVIIKVYIYLKIIFLFSSMMPCNAQLLNSNPIQ